jgi:hypothetical protein
MIAANGMTRRGEFMEPAHSDETRRRALLDSIRQQGGIDPMRAQSPLVSLEDFFVGNEDIGSIGCNLVPTGRQPERLPAPLPGCRILLAWWD